MRSRVCGESVADAIRCFARRAVEDGSLPAEVAEYAARVTVSRFRDVGGPGVARRATAYFHTVARRRVLRRHQGSLQAHRMVMDSVVRDLQESGRSHSDVWEEISRGWGDRVPQELIAEYRRRLIA